MGFGQHHPVYTGKIVRVIDGMTVEVRTKSPGQENEITMTRKLYGIEPVKDAKLATEAKALLTKLALDAEVYGDFYGEAGDWISATKGQARSQLSLALVSAGLAFRLKPIGSPDFKKIEADLLAAESKAKEKKLGVWK
jgi:endonuclease YncB( thermonuclease family)